MPNANWECMVHGDKNAFLKIYKEYYTALFHYGLSLTNDRELTKDCIQELFLDVWNTRSSIKKNVENARCYLCTWLRRKINRHRNRVEKIQPVSFTSVIADPVEMSYEELLVAHQLTEEKKVRLNRAISKLTKKQIEIIRLKYFENLGYAAIAEKTSLTTRTIYNIIYEAIHILREDESLVAHI
jgi:RNA polymerase sigma-70 factor (ECF subfamily)